jgi:hypothetical protein
MIKLEKLNVGDILIHPIHGEMTVTRIEATPIKEYIPDEQKFITGRKIHANFDRFIEGVTWITKNKNGKEVSKLIFHSWYLCRLEKK